MKKVMAIFLALGVLGVFAAGCSGGGDAAAGGDATKTDAGKTETKTEEGH